MTGKISKRVKAKTSRKEAKFTTGPAEVP